MAAHLICETCLGLWTKYAETVTEQREAGPGRKLGVMEARKAVEEAILIHETIAHPTQAAMAAKGAVKSRSNAA